MCYCYTFTQRCCHLAALPMMTNCFEQIDDIRRRDITSDCSHYANHSSPNQPVREPSSQDDIDNYPNSSKIHHPASRVILSFPSKHLYTTCELVNQKAGSSTESSVVGLGWRGEEWCMVSSQVNDQQTLVGPYLSVTHSSFISPIVNTTCAINNH